MSMAARTIHLHLEAVARERAQRIASPTLAARVHRLKAYQQRRFAHTYADLLRAPRYVGAARFFLDELYGPADFAHRDAQFQRLVPALVRLFPPDLVDTVAAVVRLHEMSERLDTETARQLPDDEPLGAPGYLAAWLRHPERADRQTQVDATADLAVRLDRLTRKPMLRATLRMMRLPAHAAGLGDLQHFLETGFDAFRAMGGANEFVATLRERERTLFDALSAADPAAPDSPSTAAALMLLP